MMTKRLLPCVVAVGIAVLVLVVPDCTGTECYECEGPYNTNVCGLNFNEAANVTVTCDGPCITSSIHGQNKVSRGCAYNETHIGCFFDDTVKMLKCNYICNTNWCNGAGHLPAKMCFSCEGLYSSTCGSNFNNDEMIRLGNTVECEQLDSCYTTTRSKDLLDKVWRGCKAARTSSHFGCAMSGDEYVCNYNCTTDYCNGASFIPQTPPSPPNGSSLSTMSSGKLTMLLLFVVCINNLLL